MNQPLLNSGQRDMFAALRNANPSFADARQPSLEGSSLAACAADRVLIAGGQLMSYLTPESIMPFEAVYRRLPIDGIFEATPQQPCQFEMGTFQVPGTMGLVLLDWNFNIYRPSGSAAGDFVLLESNRLSTQVGWNIRSRGQVQGNYTYQLNPIPPGAGTGYDSNPNPGFVYPPGPGQAASAGQFEAARYLEAQAASGDQSIMPQRHHRQGLLHVPAPWIIHSSQDVSVSCHVFRAVQIPIGFFEADLFGFLIPDSDLRNLQRALAPCLTPPGGV